MLASIEDVHCTGRTALVTGCTIGIRRAATLVLGRLGATVVVHGRDEQIGEAVVELSQNESIIISPFCAHGLILNRRNHMSDTVLSPTDGGEPSVRATEYGHSIAQLFDTTDHVINVVDIQGAAGMFDAGGIEQKFVDRLIELGETAIETVEAVVGEQDSVTTAVVEGRPSETILGYVDEHDIDLITVGTAGRTGLNRYPLGSTTERIIRHAEIPVVAVNARAQETN